MHFKAYKLIREMHLLCNATLLDAFMPRDHPGTSIKEAGV